MRIASNEVVVVDSGGGSGDELLRENGLGESPAGGISAKPNSPYQQLYDTTASTTPSHRCYLLLGEGRMTGWSQFLCVS